MTPSSKHKYLGWLFHALNIIFFVLIIGFVWWGIQSGLFENPHLLTTFIESYGAWAPFIFWFVQFVQTVIPVIPGAVTIPLGIILFGPFWGMIHNLIPIFIGSIINFLIARKFGSRIVHVIIGEKEFLRLNRWLERYKNNIKRFIAISLALPFMPGDLICYGAGLTQLNFKDYLIYLSIGKPISTTIYAFASAFVFDQLINIF